MRKIQLTEQQINSLKTLAGEGMSIERIAAALDISRASLHRIMRRDLTARLAVEKGRINFEVAVARALFEQARQGNIAAAIWLEKTRFGRHENLNLTSCLNFLVDMDIMPSALAAEILEIHHANEYDFNQHLAAVFAQYKHQEVLIH